MVAPHANSTHCAPKRKHSNRSFDSRVSTVTYCARPRAADSTPQEKQMRCCGRGALLPSREADPAGHFWKIHRVHDTLPYCIALPKGENFRTFPWGGSDAELRVGSVWNRADSDGFGSVVSTSTGVWCEHRFPPHGIRRGFPSGVIHASFDFLKRFSHHRRCCLAGLAGRRRR